MATIRITYYGDKEPEEVQGDTWRDSQDGAWIDVIRNRGAARDLVLRVRTKDVRRVERLS